MAKTLELLRRLNQLRLMHARPAECARLEAELATVDAKQPSPPSRFRNPWRKRVRKDRRLKLSQQDVDRIRARWWNELVSQAQLGREFGVTRAQVHNIVMDKAWQRKRRADATG